MKTSLQKSILAFQIYLSGMSSTPEYLSLNNNHREDLVTLHIDLHRSLREVDENAIHCINRSLSRTLELGNR